MIDRRLTPDGAAHTFFANLFAVHRVARGSMDEHLRGALPLGAHPEAEEVQGDETQYAAAGVPVDTQAALFDCAGRAKPVYDAALTAIAAAAG